MDEKEAEARPVMGTIFLVILVSSHCSNFQVTPLNPTGFKSRALKIHYYCRSHLELFSRMRMKLMA